MGIEALVVGERYVHQDYPNRIVQYAEHDGNPMGLLYQIDSDGGWSAKRWIALDTWDADRMRPYSSAS